MLHAEPMSGRGWAYSPEGGLPCRHCGGLVFISGRGVWRHSDTTSTLCPAGTRTYGWADARLEAALKD